MSTLPTNSLCTRKEVKDFRNINSSDATLDNLIHDFIGRVSTMFENYCGRKFISDTYTEYYDGGSSQIFLDNYPVTAITSLREDSDWVWDSNSEIESSEYRIMDSRSIVYDGYFEKGKQSVKVVYVAGYSTIPEDIKQVAIEEVSRLIKHRTDFDEQTKTLQDTSVAFPEWDLMPKTKQILSKYRKVAVL